MTGTTGITEASVEANGLRFGYLQAGESGPLALCLHGFPDSAWTWRHLLPELADAGYRAVAPWLRGYAPTQVPDPGHYDTGSLAVDVNALHEVLGGTDDAVLIGHDWGALIGYAAVHDTMPEVATDSAEQAGRNRYRWRRLVTLAVPPPGAVTGGFFSFDQLQRSWYMFFFQHPLSDMAVQMGDLAFIERLWADWSPGFDGSEELPHVKDALRDPANLGAALGYYRAMLGDVGINPDEEAARLRGASAGPPPLPTLYLHGRTDGCMGAEIAEAAGAFLPHAGSRVELVDDAGHFLQLERPDVVNKLILEFLAP